MGTVGTCLYSPLFQDRPVPTKAPMFPSTPRWSHGSGQSEVHHGTHLGAGLLSLHQAPVNERPGLSCLLGTPYGNDQEGEAAQLSCPPIKTTADPEDEALKAFSGIQTQEATCRKKSPGSRWTLLGQAPAMSVCLTLSSSPTL